MLIYAGVGSRRTPADVLATMTRIAERLYARGWTLRSGAADGADAAFEAGAGDRKEVWLPWPGFNGSRSGHVLRAAAMEVAAELHPAWGRLTSGPRKLHARNCHQILGETLDEPVSFVVCWTPDGAETEAGCSIDTGGTATAIRLADRHGIPVVNMRRDGYMGRLAELVLAE